MTLRWWNPNDLVEMGSPEASGSLSPAGLGQGPILQMGNRDPLKAREALLWAPGETAEVLAHLWCCQSLHGLLTQRR